MIGCYLPGGVCSVFVGWSLFQACSQRFVRLCKRNEMFERYG